MSLGAMHGSAFVTRVLHHSTCFHLCAVSYERYYAIVRRPLNYGSRITKKRAFLVVVLLWILPVLISLAPFLGWGDFVYNPDIFACEQKWDGQTAIPMSIVTFLVPLGVIIILNCKVLKVVHRLQRGVEIIHKGISNPESEGPNSKTLDYPSQQQYSRDDLNSKQHEGQRKNRNGPQHMATTSPQMLSVIVCNMLSNQRTQGEENPAYQPEPDDFTRYKNEAVGERSNAYEAQFLSVPFVGTREDCPNEINNNDINCSKGKKFRCTRPQVVENDQGKTTGKLAIQIHHTEVNHQSPDATLKDGNGLQKRGCESRRQRRTVRQRGSIQQPSSKEITAKDWHCKKMEIASGTMVENPCRVNDQKQH